MSTDTELEEDDRLEDIRASIRNENISYNEISELESLVHRIDPGDVELREGAGLPERWDGHPWSTDEQGERYRKAIDSLPAGASVADIIAAFNTVPYEDSVDRENFFFEAAHRHRVPYGDIYDAWLKGA